MTLAVLGAVIIGITMGLLGAGGSILTLPILVFLLKQPEKIAIVESLAIVGIVALLGMIPYALRKQIDWKSVGLFSLSGMLGAYIGSHAATYVTGTFQLALFALVMLTSSALMIFNVKLEHVSFSPSHVVVLIEGLLIGFLTGFLGIGGGFLIVPALHILNRLNMSVAVGTSLFIIAMNASVGLIEHLRILHAAGLEMPWKLVAFMAFPAVIGSYFGNTLGKSISQMTLKKIFGIGLLVMSVYILFESFMPFCHELKCLVTH